MTIKEHSQQIQQGLGNLTKVAVIISAVAFFTLMAIREGFKTYRSTAISTNLYGRVQANILAARMSAFKYFKSNSPENAAAVSKRLKTLDTVLAELMEHSKGYPQILETLESMKVKKANYQDAFEKVVQLENKKNEIYSTSLDVKGGKLEQIFSKISKRASQSNNQKIAMLAAEAQTKLWLARLYSNKFKSTGDRVHVERVKKEFTLLADELRQLRLVTSDTTTRRWVLSAKELSSSYKSDFESVVDVMLKSRQLITGVMDTAGPAIADKVEEMKLANKSTQDTIGPIVQWTSLFAALLLLGVALVAFRFSQNKRKELEKSVDAFAERIQNSVRELKAISTEINQSNNELKDNGISLAESVNNQKTATHETASAATQTSQSTEYTKNSMESMIRVTNEVTKLTQKGSQSIQSLVKSMAEIERSNENVQQMADSLKKIEEKVKVINEIVFQTKLLSFNAAVEAARAGEHGKGFAVVAEEMSNLSQLSGKSATEIFALLEGYLQDVGTIVAENTDKVSRGRKLVEHVSSLFGNIENQSQTNQDHSNEVLAMSGEQNVAVAEISKAISEIDLASNRIDGVVGTGDQVINKLAQQTEDLDKIVSNLSTIACAEENSRKSNLTDGHTLHLDTDSLMEDAA